MPTMNVVVLAGNLTRDPEVRYSSSGTAIARLGLAVNHRMKKGDDWVDEPCFIDVITFGRQAESCGESLTKGQPILVEGRLRLNSWTDGEGQKRSKIEVNAHRVQFLAPPQARDRAPAEDLSDDVPF